MTEHDHSADAQHFGEKPKRTIDMTPTWKSLLPIFRAVMEDGTESGKKIAWEELARMAEAADRWNAYAKED